jgi:tetratricopeptide (TPR) repeat protein
VDRDALAERDVADDRVAGHRPAALGEAQHDVVDAVDLDAVGARGAGRLAARAAVADELLDGVGLLLGGLALLGQSRGWLFALPVVAIVFVAVTPRRVRTSLTLLLAATGVALTIPAVLDVYDESGAALARAVDSAAKAIVLAAVVTGIVAALVALPDRSVRVSRVGGRRLGAALAALALVVVIAGTAVYVDRRGSPFTDIAHAWSQFKTKRTPHGGASRLGRLGSNRYDFWRVAWRRFEHAPLAGIGADNYQEAYLVHGKSAETPLYPHSVELRTLSQTGVVGALALVTGFAAAFAAAARAMRRRGSWGSAAAAGAVGGVVYWLVHGSVDWLWEFPALGGTAFALLGLAAGLAPRASGRPAPARRPLVAGAGATAAVAVAALVLALSLGAPWLADRLQTQAKQIWPDRPRRAFDKLDSASGLNPLSPLPKVFAGAIALRLDRLALAERYYREALDRDPRYAAAYLELGAIALNTGRRPEAVRLLARAATLQPRDEVTARVLRRARAGRSVDIAAMNESLRRRTVKLGR